MAEIITVARPYAEAAFRLAQDENRLAQWEETLSWLEALMQTPEVFAVVTHPERRAADASALLVGLMGEHANAEVERWIEVLAENHRLVLSSEIAAQFKQLKQAAEGRVTAHITSAYPVTQAQRDTLTRLLTAQYQKQIELTVDVDPALIGGIMIKVGDTVVDASVRGKLHSMAVSLTS